jgi:hypothetical protein
MLKSSMHRVVLLSLLQMLLVGYSVVVGSTRVAFKMLSGTLPKRALRFGAATSSLQCS